MNEIETVGIAAKALKVEGRGFFGDVWLCEGS